MMWPPETRKLTHCCNMSCKNMKIDKRELNYLYKLCTTQSVVITCVHDSVFPSTQEVLHALHLF